MTWDVTGLSYDSKTFTPVSSTFDVQAFCLDDTGTRLYVQHDAGWPDIDQYTLSVPFDIDSAGAVIGSHEMNSPGHANTFPGTLWMNLTGNRIYTLNHNVSTNNTEIWELTLAVAYDITSVSGTVVLDVNTQVGDFGFAACMNESGSRLYVAESNSGGFDGQTIHQWDLTPGDISTAAYASKTFDPAAQTTTPQHIAVGNLDTTLLVGNSSGDIWQYSMSIAGDIDTASYDSKTYDLAGDVADISRMDWHITACSTKFYSTGQSGGTGDEVLYQWDMGTAGGCLSASPLVACTGVYVEGGTVRLAVDVLAGFWWLGGATQCKAVTALVDGNVTELEVCDGVITFPRLAARAHIGLPYTTDIETLNIEDAGGGTIQGGRKKVTDVTTRFYKSRLPLIGPNFFDMVQMKQREDEKYGESTSLLTGDKTTNIPPSWDSNGRVAYRIKDPVPCTWLAVIPEFEVEDDG